MLEDLRKTVCRFDRDLQGILGNNYHDVLITGSAVLDDYTPGRGDIDFIVLLENDIDDSEIEKIVGLHEGYRANTTNLEWQLEGCYYPKRIMDDRAAEFIGYYVGTRRKGWKKIFGNAHNVFDWILLAEKCYSHKHHVYSVAYPSCGEIADYITSEAAVWESLIEDLEVPAYAIIQWAVRVLFYIKNNAIASKSEALDFAYENFLKSGTILNAKAMRAPCDKALFESENADSRAVARQLLMLVKNAMETYGEQ